LFWSLFSEINGAASQWQDSEMAYFNDNSHRKYSLKKIHSGCAVLGKSDHPIEGVNSVLVQVLTALQKRRIMRDFRLLQQSR